MPEQVGEIQSRTGYVPVWRLAPGEKVEFDGVFDVSAERYHGDVCVGPSISSTGLRRIYHKSPLHYWDSSLYNPNAEETSVEKAEAKAFRIGRAAHTLMLEPHLFGLTMVARPEIFADWKTQASRKWRAEKQASGLTVLEPAEMQEIAGIARALKAHPLYRDGILEGDIEKSIIWKDKATGVWIKARPDVIPRGTNVLSDLKTTNDASTDALAKKVFRLGYDMQMALGGIGMETVLGRVVDEYVLIAVESTRPHAITIRPIPDAEIGRARSMLRYAVNKFAECISSGEWPSFEKDDNDYLYRTSFAAKMIDAEITNGTLPKEF